MIASKIFFIMIVLHSIYILLYVLLAIKSIYVQWNVRLHIDDTWIAIAVINGDLVHANAIEQFHSPPRVWFKLGLCAGSSNMVYSEIHKLKFFMQDPIFCKPFCGYQLWLHICIHLYSHEHAVATSNVNMKDKWLLVVLIVYDYYHFGDIYKQNK